MREKKFGPTLAFKINDDDHKHLREVSQELDVELSEVARRCLRVGLNLAPNTLLDPKRGGGTPRRSLNEQHS